MNLKLHPLARREYEDAVDWYQSRSDQLGTRFSSEVEKALAEIFRHPEQNARLDEIHFLYVLARFPYYLVYRLMGGSVVVVAIRHNAQQQNVWQAR
jgi:plasmid stabilization system protein ParE